MNRLNRMAAIPCLLLFVPSTSSLSASRFDQEGSPTAAAAEATQHNAAGLSKARNRDLDGAIVEFSEAIRLDPTYAEAFRNRGFAKMNKNLLDEAIDDFSHAIVLNARDATALYNRGTLFARKRQFDRAIGDFSAALAINPTVANYYDNRGLAKTDSGDVDGGIADLTTAISLDPKSARAYLNRGYANSKKKNDTAALSDYSQAITLNPSYALAYSNRGEVKARHEDQVGAIADFTTALKLDSARALPYYYRGQAKLTAGDRVGAIADFTAFLDRTPRHAGALTGRCQAHREQGELELALADCNAALDIPPVNAHTLSERGEVKTATGDIDGAIRDLSEALALEPTNADSRYRRCRVLVKRGNLADALSDCTEATRLDPTLASAYLELAGIRERRGDVTAALSDYGRAITLLLRPRTLVRTASTGAGPLPAGTAGVTSPTPIREVKPNYTFDAMREKIQGTVGLECVVGRDGTVVDVRVVRSLDRTFGLDEAAVKAARQWLFRPGMRNGEPVAVLITIELSFHLKSSPSPDSEVPLAWPEAFSTPADSATAKGAASDQNGWTIINRELPDLRAQIAYPTGWIVAGGLATGTLVVNNSQETIGLTANVDIRDTSPPLLEPVTRPRVQQFSDSVRLVLGKSPMLRNAQLQLVAEGQIRVSDRVWLWADFSFAGITGQPFEGGRWWSFTTQTGARAVGVSCFVTHQRYVAAPVSAAPVFEAQVQDAGAVCVQFLRRLSLESR
jgi:TonB family protein